MSAVAAPPDGVTAAKNNYMLGPNRREVDYKRRFSNHAGAWAMVFPERGMADRDLSSVGLIAGCHEASGDVRGFESYPGENTRNLSGYKN